MIVSLIISLLGVFVCRQIGRFYREFGGAALVWIVLILSFIIPVLFLGYNVDKLWNIVPLGWVFLSFLLSAAIFVFSLSWTGRDNADFGTKKTVKPQAFTTGDDLKKVEGIGPQVQKVLYAHGINTFEKLSKADPKNVQKILDQFGNRFKALTPSTRPKQAEMAHGGKWGELKVWQDKLKG